MSKTALLCAGGGMRGAYGCGVLDVFLEHNINFDYAVAVSSGAANAVSFLAGQKGRNYRFYIEHPKEKEYLGLYPFIKTGSFFGLEYIYGDLSRCIDPVNYENLIANPSKLEIVATDIYSGNAKYFTKEDMSKKDYSVLMASCCVPIFCKPVKIGEHNYLDGGLADPLPVDRCLEEGCDKIIAISPRDINIPKKPENFHFAYKNILKQYPEAIKSLETRHIRQNKSIAKLKELESQGKAMIIYPSKDIKVSMFSKNNEPLKNLYANGVYDAWSKIDEIKDFLK